MATKQLSPLVRIDLTDIEWRTLKARLAMEGKTLSLFFRDHATRYLNRQEKLNSVVGVGELEEKID